MEKLIKLPNCYEILGIPHKLPQTNYTARPLIDYGALPFIDVSRPMFQKIQKVSPLPTEVLGQSPKYHSPNLIPLKTTTWFERNWLWILLVIVLIGALIIFYINCDSNDSLKILSSKITKEEKKTT